MLSNLATLAALLPVLNAQATYGNKSWMGLPGSLYGVSGPWGSSVDSNWPQSNVGQQLVPQAPDAELQEMLAEIDEDSGCHVPFAKALKWLTFFGRGQEHRNDLDELWYPAHTLSAELVDSRHWRCSRLDTWRDAEAGLSLIHI